jgi:hypothetical protein
MAHLSQGHQSAAQRGIYQTTAHEKTSMQKAWLEMLRSMIE